MSTAIEQTQGALTREPSRQPRSPRGTKGGQGEVGADQAITATRTGSPIQTDDEILGIDGGVPPVVPQRDDWEDSLPTDSGTGEKPDKVEQGKPGSPSLEDAFKTNPELKQAWEDAQAYRESFRTPAEARSATVTLAEVARMDALFFSGRPQDHAELARAVASLDLVAFRSLAQAMSAVAEEGAGSGGAKATLERSALSTGTQRSSNNEESRVDRGTIGTSGGEGTSTNGVPAPSRGDLTPAQETFFHATNAAVVRSVIDAIESQIERLLPEEISKGARNRLVGEIYREVDASLRSDREFARQTREAFRTGAFDDEHRKAIISLVHNRARQTLPAAARRVLNEWTTAIVAANQDRRARQRAAERRVDISGSGRTGNDGRRPISPRDINYSRMSDADILNL
jgi:hypothetical protein